MTTRIVVECDKGHKFSTTGHRLSQKKWCRYCSKTRKIPEADIKQIIEAKGGRFLERFRNGPSTRIRLQCSKGHEWESAQSHIQAGHWCMTCHLDRNKERLELANVLATNKGGISLATECKTSMKRIVWQCEKKHQFKASIDEVKNKDYWCPVCAHSKRRMKMVLDT